MMDAQSFDQKQLELTAEFGKYVFDHPEVDDQIPDGAYVFFDLDGDAEFTSYSRQLAERQRKLENVPIIFVKIKGLAPRQGSRLIDPVIEPVFMPRRKTRKKVRPRTAKS